MAPLQSNGKIPPNSTLAAAMLTYAKILNFLVASVLYFVNNCVLFWLTNNERIELIRSSQSSTCNARSALIPLPTRSRDRHNNIKLQDFNHLLSCFSTNLTRTVHVYVACVNILVQSSYQTSVIISMKNTKNPPFKCRGHTHHESSWIWKVVRTNHEVCCWLFD